jgi:hypothetical protein
MNRAKRYSGPFALTLAVLAFGAGLYLGVVGFAPKPEIRTVVQSPTHVAASMVSPQADDVLRRLATRASCAPSPGIIVPYSELEGCILAYLNNALQSPRINREGQIPAVTTQPYSLHPGKTPLVDPTQDAYYKKLLKEGRFPTSGSSEGRPR